MVDNFDSVRSVLAFENPDALYFVQLIQRRKDIPELDVTHRLVKSYYIRSASDFERVKESIIRECTLKQARAYIDLNAKDVKKVALLALNKTADLIYNAEYDAVRNVYDHSVGNASCLGEKVWLIDVDTQDTGVLQQVCSQVKELGADIRLQVPSRNGFHVITTPFPVNKFNDIDDVDIQKHQARTLLYMP